VAYSALGTQGRKKNMLRTFIQAAMQQAHYELIDQPGTPYYGEVPGLQGVMATGESLEECRVNLEDALDAWLVLGLQLGHAIPEIDGIKLERLQVAS
jgi:predicted RNase H-like HicB family nuclease